MRGVLNCDSEIGRQAVLLSYLFGSPALTIAAIYKNRGQIGLFFK